jgi:putative multiple sugar transport system permease protein
METKNLISKIKELSKSNIRQYGMIIALVLITVFFQVLTDGILLKPLNITNLVLQNSYILILAIGMLLCILTGNIDLSVGSVVAFVGAVSAIFSVRMNMPVPVTIILSLLIGALIGAWQGYWIAYVRIPPFIVTLAGMLIFRGLTMVVLQGQTISPFPASYQIISSGFIPDFFGGEKIHITTIVVGVILSLVYIFMEWKQRQNTLKYEFEVLPLSLFIAKLTVMVLCINVFAYFLALYRGIPNVFIVLGLLILIYSFITNKTIAGRHVYAFGGNEKAAKLSGVKTNRVLFWVYVNMSLLAALAGIVFAGRLNAATPKAGTSFEMDAIAACYIGGASASGGIGTVVGAIIGGLIMGILNNGMSIMGLSIDWQQAIKGLVLLMAVAFDVYTKNRVKK